MNNEPDSFKDYLAELKRLRKKIQSLARYNPRDALMHLSNLSSGGNQLFLVNGILRALREVAPENLPKWWEVTDRINYQNLPKNLQRVLEKKLQKIAESQKTGGGDKKPVVISEPSQEDLAVATQEATKSPEIGDGVDDQSVPGIPSTIPKGVTNTPTLLAGE